jgi:ribonuclease HIII
MNLNDLLAYAHARAIEPLLQKTDAVKVMVDKFGHEKLVSEQLVNQSGNIDLIQVNRSETNVAVASASILARSHYLLKLSEMSTKVGIELSKGVSPKVIKQARQFVEKYGKNKLAYVAKLHFKTTKQLKVPGI